MLSRRRFITLAGPLAASFWLRPAMAQVRAADFRLAHQSTPDSVQGQSLRVFVKNVLDRSGGKMKIKIFDSDVLGNESQVISLGQSGTLDFFALPPQPLTKIVPNVRVWGFPGLFPTPEIALGFSTSDVAKAILAEFATKSNLTGISVWPTALRVVMNNKRPIDTVADFKGLKLRVIQDKLFLDMFNSLDAKPITISWSDVYTSLETGVVDGTDTVLTSANMAAFYEVQKYLTLTNHVYDVLAVIASSKTMNGLNDEERKIIYTSAYDAAAFQTSKGVEMYKAAVENMKKHGVKVNSLSKEEWNKMATLMKKAAEPYRKEMGEALTSQIDSTLARLEKA